MSIHPTLVAITFALCTLTSPFIYAADLMDIFRSARDHDPTWAAQENRFAGDKQLLTGVESGLYPKIATSAETRAITTSGNGLAIINPVYLEDQAIGPCLINLNNGAPDCDPSLIIRDDIRGHYDTYTITTSLFQPLYDYGLWRKYTQAKIVDKKSDIEHEQHKQALIITVANSYFAVLKAHEQWELANAKAQSKAKQLEQTKKRFGLGLLPRRDVYDVRAATDLSKVKLLIARTQLENAQETLMLSTQRRDVSIATLSDKLVAEPPQPRNVEDWVKKGLALNRSLQIAHSETLIAQEEIQVQRGDFHPKVYFGARHIVSKNDEAAFQSSPSVTTQGVGIQFNYAIYQGGLTTSKVKKAHHQYNSSLDLFEEERRQVIRDVRNSYRKVNNDVRGVEAASQAIHSAQKSLEASNAAYKNGLIPLTSVLKAQDDLFTAKKEHANARYAFILDSLQLKYTAGTLKIEDLQIINSWLNPDKLILPPDLMSENESVEDLFY